MLKHRYPDPLCPCSRSMYDCGKFPQCAYRTRKSNWQKFKEWLLGSPRSSAEGRAA